MKTVQMFTGIAVLFLGLWIADTQGQAVVGEPCNPEKDCIPEGKCFELIVCNNSTGFYEEYPCSQGSVVYKNACHMYSQMNATQQDNTYDECMTPCHYGPAAGDCPKSYSYRGATDKATLITPEETTVNCEDNTVFNGYECVPCENVLNSTGGICCASPSP